MKYIDIEKHPRKDIYKMFKEYENPYFSLTTEIDITEIFQYATESKLSLFKILLFATVKVINDIPELKQRLRVDSIVEHDMVHPSFTVINDDNVFNFCTVNYNKEFEVFYRSLEKEIDNIKTLQSLQVVPDRDDLVYITCLPWVSFTQIGHPVRIKGADSVPRIAWGKYKKENGNIFLPYNMQVHHSLVDGYHLALFFKEFETLVNDRLFNKAF